MTENFQRGLVWFRRDLRHFDHAALHHALRACEQVYCVFVFDRDILDALPSSSDRRVGFINASVIELDAALGALAETHGGTGGLIVCHASAREAVVDLASELKIDAVFANRDYEPAARTRDAEVAEALQARGIAFNYLKDQVIFERDEILTQAGTPYAVFTPYKRAWQKALTPFYLQSYSVASRAGRLRHPPNADAIPSLQQLGFDAGNLAELALPTGMQGGEALFSDFRDRIDDYKKWRDYPAKKGVSYLSVHLRFGTVSIRQLAGFAHTHGGQGAENWLGELIWRDFYHMVLWHRPDVVDHCFREQHDALEWDDRPEWFVAWCEGRTGYPLVNAGMRQLNQTGYMHNRLRMIVASFLTKDLGIDWRLGERYFADKLNDYDLAANNGGWQWAASTGCDAQPWFRIFNPVTQSEKFDPDGHFIRRYVPELEAAPDKYIHAPWTMPDAVQKDTGVHIGDHYPSPLVDHKSARERTLARFRAVS